ncbi:MAG: PstS family phosphate ABC transporter substrate-binding protein, partial [Ignavibacteria bacterium]
CILAMIKKSLVNLILVTCSLIFFGCDYGKIRSVTTIGETTIGVDESVSPVLRKESDEFMRLNKESKINQKIKTSNELLADLINGDIKTIVVKRDFNQQEMDLIDKYKIEIKRNKFALDGVGIIVNPVNPIKKLNYNELRKIFLRQINDWKDLDGDNKDLHKGKINVFITRKNAATHDFFREKVLANSDFPKSDVVCSTSVQMLGEVKNDKNAIGFISMNWVTKFADTLDTIVKPLKIAPVDSAGRIGDYVGLHQAYIANGTYPLVMETHIFSTDFDLNVSAGFISFLLSYDGQKIVLNSGLVPVTQPVRIIQLN